LEPVVENNELSWENRRVGPESGSDPVENGSTLRDCDDSGDVAGGFHRWRNESALGAIGIGVARGLQAVFAPPVDEPVIVAAVPGEPPDADTRVRVILDPDDPTKSVAIVPDPPAHQSDRGTTDPPQR
jgi:hypothetical protein